MPKPFLIFGSPAVSRIGHGGDQAVTDKAAESAPNVSKKSGVAQIARDWGVLVLLTAACVALLSLAQLPAGILLGAIVAGIATALSGRALAVPRPVFYFAHGIIGVMMARSIPPSFLDSLSLSWPLFLGGVAWAMAVAAFMGWLLARLQVLPGATAVWGMSPGAASAMMLMCEDYGVDMRLVAFMQYSRVLVVAVLASVLSRFFVASSAVSTSPAAMAVRDIDWPAFAMTLAASTAGVVAARKLRIPGGTILLPMLLGVALSTAGVLTIELPRPLLYVCYPLVGWTVGLRFTRAILVHAARALPRMLAGIIGMTLLCALYAVVLAWGAGIDPLTAYLSTSPGGADTIAIIAMSSNVDAAFIMTMQTMRLILVMAVGPSLARFVARRTGF